ncbi:hypothetical protein CKO28_00500 [Rhodovibrio sodomensis]|uniref:HD/PDEase domain-containing protein n=1 Tax=Rhodovibrio sodomensis TaxID=1088 RepID=A0ABS1D840_9PROT|nr:dNTP triphosphohydrolase [Rhodovibrio sodomensis]MBK1666520.1 hypothetical protein [Rhodovibrio sodomensis]
MDWGKLLNSQRLMKDDIGDFDPHRSPFEVDADRVIFASDFRRLQDKTQVHGATGNDYVRNRLTHSLEVSRVGRSLGTIVAARLAEHPDFVMPDGSPISARDAGHVVAAASLAHDFGTPPFAHTGEDVISDFFARHPLGSALIADLSPRMQAELTRFEGNAQGFRVLARLQGWRENGGLQLTLASLAAHSKYPYPADCDPQYALKPNKYGYFESEAELFEQVAHATGMVQLTQGAWARHPLAHLVEAADDICYRIVDVEDAAVLGVLSFEEAEGLLAPVAGPLNGEYGRIPEPTRKLTYLRSKAISRLIEDTADAYFSNICDILDGEHPGDLVLQSPVRDQLKHIERVSRTKIYANRKRAQSDLAACRILETILEAYCDAFYERETSNSGRLSARSKMVLRAFPGAERLPVRDRAGWLRGVLDYVSGMCDGFAAETAKVLAP